MVYDETAGENIKTTIYIAQNQIFVTFGLIILLNLKVNVLLNCTNCISERYDICKVFLTFFYVELLHQMTGLSLCVEKFIQTSLNTHTHARTLTQTLTHPPHTPRHTHTNTQTHTHARTHARTHTLNLMTYLDRSTASFLPFFLGKRS